MPEKTLRGGGTAGEPPPASVYNIRDCLTLLQQELVGLTLACSVGKWGLATIRLKTIQGLCEKLAQELNQS